MTPCKMKRMFRLVHKKQYVVQKNEGTGEYFIEGWPCAPTRVTTFVSEQFPVFDADVVAARMDRTKGKYKGTPWYMRVRMAKKRKGMTAEQCKEDWKKKAEEARDAGTELHKLIEFVLEEKTFSGHLLPLHEVEAVTDVIKKIKDEFGSYICSEVPICSDEDTLLAGTFDAMFFHKEGRVLLVDWKRSENLYKWTPDVGLKSMSKHRATKAVKYSLQLNIYKWILEKYYDLEANGTRTPLEVVPYIVHFVSGTNRCHLLPALNLKREVEEMMKDRRAAVELVTARLRSLKRGAAQASLPSSEEKKSDER